MGCVALVCGNPTFTASLHAPKWVENPDYQFVEVEAEIQRVKTVRKVNRSGGGGGGGGLTQSFRKHFMQKTPPAVKAK